MRINQLNLQACHFPLSIVFITVTYPQTGNPCKSEEEGVGETTLSNIVNMDFISTAHCQYYNLY